MAKNPQSLSLNRFGNQDFYAPAKNNSQKGQPLRVQTNDGIIIKVVKTGSVKYAEASTGQQTTPEPFVSSNLSQNLTLINQLLSTYFPLSFVTNILEQEPAAEEANKGTAQSQPTEENRISDNVPLDLRLVYLIDDKTGNVLYSLSTDVEKGLHKLTSCGR